MNNLLEQTLNQSMLTKAPVEIEKVIKTTPSQTEIWLACKMGGKEANMAYNESVSLQLKGNLSVESLKKAFLELIRRHDGMRTIISPNGKNLLVFSSYELPIRFRDISHLSEAEQQCFFRKHTKEIGNYHFNLSQGPLYVMELIKINDLHHEISFTGHHIIFDGWSIGLMLEELSELYSKSVQSLEMELPDPDLLGEYSAELINRSRKFEHKETKKYWKNYLSNPLPDFSLPISKDRPIHRTYDSDVLGFPLPTEIIKQIKKTSSEEKVSLNLVILSIFEIFLSRWSGEEEVVVGMPVSGQLGLNRPRLIGHCVHLLPLRSEVDMALPFSQYLQQRKANYNQALDHQFLSFGNMIQDLPIKRDSSKVPLIPITFNIDLDLDAKVDFVGLDHKLSFNPKAYANFEIILNLYGNSDEFIFEWTYNKSLFDRDYINHAGNDFVNYLKAFTKDRTLTIQEIIREIEVNSPKEEEPSIDLQVTELEFVSFGKYFFDSVRQYPNKVALMVNHKEFTYQELGKKVKNLAGFLHNKGVKSGDIIGIHLERDENLIITELAVISVGAGILPIDTDFPEERVKFMLEDADVKFFISDTDSVKWGDLESKKLGIPIGQILDQYELFTIQNFDPINPALIIYTSGSTGKPKGVELSHQNLFYFTQQVVEQPGLSNEDKVLGLTSISFDMAWLETVLPLTFGASLYLLGKYERKDQREIFNALKDQRITKLYITPSHLKSLIQYMGEPKLEGLTIISAGEPLSRKLADSLLNVADSVYNIYGPSETTVFATIKKINSFEEEITIGKPVKNSCVILVDEQGKIIPIPGKMGEIWIGGTCVGNGYLNRPELTKERFVPSPFKGYDGKFYKSGDLGLWNEEGDLLCKGRIDHQVKIRGQRLELGEIESELVKDALIKNAVVIKVLDANGEGMLRAHVSFVEGQMADSKFSNWVDITKGQLSKKLASFMIPTEFVQQESFELNSNGKIDRKLLERFRPTSVFSDTSNQDKEIKSSYSSVLAVKKAWEQVLKRELQETNEDFFQIGGHSLLAVDLLSKLETHFKINLPLSTLFEFPTIEMLASHIEHCKKEENKGQSKCLVKIKEGDPNKVLLFIHGVGLNPLEINTLVENLDEDQTIWGLQSPSILDASLAPLSSIEQIAQVYIEQIRIAGLQGPYHLMGNSLGGLIAFEMAKQFIKMGDRVQFLGMIDTIAFNTDKTPTGFFNKLSKLFKRLWYEIKFIIRDPGFYLSYRKKYLLEKRDNWRARFQKKSNLFSRIKEIENVNMEAWKNYVHEPVDVNITLFLANRRTFYVEDFKTFGWTPFAKDIKVIRMPGEHANMLKPPHGAEFTKTLQNILNSYTN